MTTTVPSNEIVGTDKGNFFSNLVFRSEAKETRGDEITTVPTSDSTEQSPVARKGDDPFANPPPYSAHDDAAGAQGAHEVGATLSGDSKEVLAEGHDLQITDTQLVEQATASFPPVPPGTELPSLPKPVYVPRVNPGANMPFARAWAPELENHAITQADFLEFIDHLNILCAPHPSIYVVQLAAIGIGFIPYDAAEGVSAAIGALAEIATVVAAQQRKKMYFERMNETYFHPRKLHVKTTGTKKMMKRFKLDKKDPLIAPLTEETLDLSAQERCLKHLSQWTCELTFDVPAPSPQTKFLAKVSNWHVRHKTNKANKEARWSRKRAWKRHQKGKKLKEGFGERMRVKGLTWVVIQNLDEWETQKAEKLAEKEAKKRKKQPQQRSTTWMTIE